MNQSPSFTTIVPVYNGEQFVDHCMKNLLQQTYQNHQIVVVDDGSSDQSGDLLDEWAAQNSKIHVIHTTNKGVSSARNTGISYVIQTLRVGGYIHFVDIDDELSISCYEELSKIINEQPSEPDLVLFGYTQVILNIDGEPIQRSIITPKKQACYCGEELKKHYFDYYGIRTGLRNAVWLKLFRIKAFEEIRFHEDMKQAEDLYYSIDTLCVANSMLTLDKAYYTYYKASQPKGYYDADIQMAFDRNKYICDRIIAFGVDQQQGLEEYYHKVLDTTYDFCMLMLRSDNKDASIRIHDALEKLNALNVPQNLTNKTLQQKAISIACKLKFKQFQSLFLRFVYIAAQNLKH